MNNKPQKENQIQYPEERIRYLEEVNRSTQDALEMAACLGDFQTSINKLQEPSLILHETRSRIQRLIRFQAIAFFLVDETDNEFSLAGCEPENYSSYLKNEMDFLIDNGTFAWALRERRPIFISSKDFKKQIVFHVMATSSRVRGLFVGLLEKGKTNAPDTALSLLSIILLNSSNALESFELYKMMREINKNLAKKENYRTLFEAAPDGVEVLDARGNVVDCNKAHQLMLGYSNEEIIGNHTTEFFSDNYKALFKRKLPILKDTGFAEGEIELVHRDGQIIPVWRKEKAIYNENMEFVGSVIYNRDISIRKRAEEKLKEAHDKLEERVIERTKDLHRINKQLNLELKERKQAEEEKRKLEAQLQRAQKMEALGTLAGGVAHDLNNVLGGLVSYPELLLMEMPEDSPLRKPILTIQKSGEKAATIVQDLLTLARRGVAVTEVADLNDIISEYLKSPEYEKLKLYHPDVQVEANLETDLLNILGSPVHLSKTVMNLVSNAAEAMHDGGTISISTENRYIDSPIRGYDDVAAGDYITLAVSDTGVGISPEDMERIFEPFYTKKVMGRSGTGLGMAVVWGTVKDHKGYIDVKSAEGKGTTFTLYFPVTREVLTKDKSLRSIEDYRGKGESILVVDDVEEQRKIASRILKRLGYFATSVSSGEEAVDYMKVNSANLLLLDMIMDPGIDGLETYKRILELHPKQKAIIVSGFSETELVKEAQRLGAGAYVKKPYLLEKIGLAVRDELDK